MAAEREKEADKLIKKGNKEIGPSLLEFRFKPDYEQAAPLFERAAVIYKVWLVHREKAFLLALPSRAPAWRHAGLPPHPGMGTCACA